MDVRDEFSKVNDLDIAIAFSRMDCNCAYTTSGGSDVKVSVPALLKLMSSIPKKPTILTMDIQILKQDILPDNTIFISKDIAEALEEALSK